MKKTPKNKLWIAAAIALAIALVGIGMRMIDNKHLREATENAAIVNVLTIQAAGGPVYEEVILPGNIEAWHQATLYARTDGYVVNWLVDIGTQVKKGQLLAVISAPEVNAALQQAEADLNKAIADFQYAELSAIRWKDLLKTESVSQQETDEKVSAAEAQAASVFAARANRDKQRDLVSYQRIIAPFNGLIMARNTDIGKLINAGSGQGLPLFRIVQADRLRIYVELPQNYARGVVKGMKAQLRFTEHPGKSFDAVLLDTAKSIDAKTRTLLMQFIINNSNLELMPGSYTQVYLQLPSPKGSVRIPVNALVFRSAGLQIATLDKENRVILKSITVGRDFGDQVEVTYGLVPGETVIINPPDSLTDGQKVNVLSESVDKGKK